MYTDYKKGTSDLHLKEDLFQGKKRMSNGISWMCIRLQIEKEIVRSAAGLREMNNMHVGKFSHLQKGRRLHHQYSS
jgi:hypothetical protein